MGDTLIFQNIVFPVVHIQKLQQILLYPGYVTENIPVTDPLIQGQHGLPVLGRNNQRVQNPHGEQGFLQPGSLLFLQLLSEINRFVELLAGNPSFRKQSAAAPHCLAAFGLRVLFAAPFPEFTFCLLPLFLQNLSLPLRLIQLVPQLPLPGLEGIPAQIPDLIEVRPVDILFHRLGSALFHILRQMQLPAGLLPLVESLNPFILRLPQQIFILAQFPLLLFLFSPQSVHLLQFSVITLLTALFLKKDFPALFHTPRILRQKPGMALKRLFPLRVLQQLLFQKREIVKGNLSQRLLHLRKAAFDLLPQQFILHLLLFLSVLNLPVPVLFFLFLLPLFGAFPLRLLLFACQLYLLALQLCRVAVLQRAFLLFQNLLFPPQLLILYLFFLQPRAAVRLLPGQLFQPFLLLCAVPGAIYEKLGLVIQHDLVILIKYLLNPLRRLYAFLQRIQIRLLTVHIFNGFRHGTQIVLREGLQRPAQNLVLWWA